MRSGGICSNACTGRGILHCTYVLGREALTNHPLVRHLDEVYWCSWRKSVRLQGLNEFQSRQLVELRWSVQVLF